MRPGNRVGCCWLSLLLLLPLVAAATNAAVASPTQIRTELTAIREIRNSAEACDLALESAHQRATTALSALESLGVEIDIRPAAFHNEIGVIRRRQAHCESRDDGVALQAEALQAYEKAVALERRDALTADDRAVYLFNYAMALASDGRTDAAVLKLSEAVSLDAEFNRREDYAEDRAELEKLLATLPDSSSLRRLEIPPLPEATVIALSYKPPLEAVGKIASNSLSSQYKDGKLSTDRTGGSYRFVTYRQGQNVVTKASDYVPAGPVNGQSELMAQIIQKVMTVASVVVQSPDGSLLRLDGLDSVSGLINLEIERALAGTAITTEKQRQIRDSMVGVVKAASSPEALFARMASEVAYLGPFWDESKLDLGDWYEATVSGESPAFPGEAISQHHRFKVARQLPCPDALPSSAPRRCVELVLVIEPAEDDLRRITKKLLRHTDVDLATAIKSMDFRISTTHTLVVDPQTLANYSGVTEEMKIIEVVDRKGETSLQVQNRRQQSSIQYENLRH